MQIGLLSLLFATVLVQAQVTLPRPAADPSQPKARIEGAVFSTAGEPLRKVTLRLRMTQSSVPGTAVDSVTYVSESDAAGRYLFEDLEPGRYTLSADRPGFVRQNYGARSNSAGGTQLSVSTGQHLGNFDFKLTPQGVISGKVTDEDGDPLPNAFVQLYRFVFTQGRRQLQPTGGGNTNAEGAFMIAQLAAGRYYLSATDNRNRFNGMQERPGRRGPEEGYATTYLPNSLTVSGAAPIELSAGSDVRGLEVRLRRARMFHVSGKLVTSIAAASVQNQSLILAQRDTQEVLNYQRPTAFTRDKDGSFDFGHITPGTYVIQSQPNGGPASLVAYYEITVGDQNLEGLSVPLGKGLEIAGSIRTEGMSSNSTEQQAQAIGGAGGRTSPTASLGTKPSHQPSITLAVTEGPQFGGPNTTADDSGIFQLHATPGRFRVNVYNLPDGTYVKSIKFENQDISKSALDLTQGSGGALDILLSPDAGEVSGVVRNGDGGTVPGVMVTMWEHGEDATGIGVLPKTANTDQNGSFRIRNVAPGEYRLVAWEDVEMGLALDPDFRKHFESQSTVLKLSGGSRASTDLKLLLKDAIEEEAAKVR